MLGEPGGGAHLASHLTRVEYDRTSSRHSGGRCGFFMAGGVSYGPRNSWENPQIYWQKSPGGEPESAAFLAYPSANPPSKHAGLCVTLYTPSCSKGDSLPPPSSFVVAY